ncbi:MAG: HEAT repeat domain-containing protein [Bacteroidota bacterium]|nr:HEAT repeat domain-containing protein [Bacteroidota bacterium]
MTLHKNLTGDIAFIAKDLYYKLKLTEDAGRAFRYGRWPKKIKAVQEAACFDYKAPITLIQQLISSRNEVLRMEAQIALIRLDDSPDALSFLKFYKYTLSEYEYIHIINAIEHENQNINLEPLFESSNDTVVIFALRLSGHLGQVNNYDRIIELLRHGSPRIREASIFALGQLSLPQSVEPLMNFYQIETYQNKINILKVIQRLPIQSCQPWLIKTIKEEHDYAIRLAALKALQNTNRTGEDIIKISFVEADDELRSLIRHVNDKRI